jgi:stage II sporulation protein M
MQLTNVARSHGLYLGIICGLFLVCAFFSFFVPAPFSFLGTYLERIFTEARTLTGIDLFLFIFLNNVKAAFLGMIGGILFGIVPLLVAGVNGVVIGYVGALVTAREGFGELWRLLPHGIFELPALFFSLALGLRLGMLAWGEVQGVIDGKKHPSLLEGVREALLLFCVIILPLLLLAGIIESLLISQGV